MIFSTKHIAASLTLLCCVILSSCHDGDTDFGSRLDGVWELERVAIYQNEWLSRPEMSQDFEGTYDDWCEYIGGSWIDMQQWSTFPGTPQSEYEVSLTDEDYMVLMFKGSVVTVLASGEMDNEDIIKVPMPFTSDGDCIKGMLFQTDYSEGSYRIINITDNSFDLVLDDYGWDKSSASLSYDYNIYDSFGVERIIYTYKRIR